MIGLENARLYEEAEKNAAMAERGRLARELHDAVTQTLFSASLIAEVLPQIWEQDPEEGRRRLEDLRQSTRGALAEMRTLLLELRPTALLQAETGELFKYLVNAFTGRTRVPARLVFEGAYRAAGRGQNRPVPHCPGSLEQYRQTCRSGTGGHYLPLPARRV